MIRADSAWLEAVAYGGAILGGGGGGSLEEGLRLGKRALEEGCPAILDVEELPEDSLIATVSAVGAPSGREHHAQAAHYIRAVELLCDHLGNNLGGLITSEMGGLASINGLIQSVALGIPVLDAAGNGRAHPTGLMGAMGLSSREDFVAIQVAVGGSPPIEVYAKGKLSQVARIVRRTAELAGGLVAVARNPVPLTYVKENAAIGVLSQAAELGRAFLQETNGEKRARRVAEALAGRVVATDRVDAVQLASQGGFDVGQVQINGLVLTFWNEYITLERGDQRLATFPDLMVTMDAESGLPLTTSDISAGQVVTVITAPKESLRLGAGMRDPALFREVEAIMGKSIVDYVFRGAG